MGKASSSKKIKKVQQAGVSRAPGQRRNMGYPALIAAIVIVGCVGVFFARNERAASASEAPVANQDHWHAAYGLDLCGEFQPNPADDGPDTAGIHTHQDGLIHIHPWLTASSGDNATFSVFAKQIGVEVTDTSITLPDGTTYENGDDCEGEDGKKEPGRVVLWVWPPQATESTEPTVITEDIANTRFRKDGEAFVLAFVPEGAEPKLPPSIPELAAPSDLEPGAASDPGSTDFTTTTPSTSTPVEGETTTTTSSAPPTTEAGTG